MKIEGSASHHHQPITTTALVDQMCVSTDVGTNYHHQQHRGGAGGGGDAGGGSGGRGCSGDVEAIKGKIIAHPRYSHLLQAYLDCQKVGAPPEVASRLAAAWQEFEMKQRSTFQAHCRDASKDPELDQFMEAYCNMLVKYREELARPTQEAIDFMKRMESQLNVISNGYVQIFTCGISSLFSDERFI
ncbi:Homeotic protein knotted-1 [Dionaea muscipula]